MSEHEPRMSRAQRRQRTEARILAAAREQFAEVGYDRTTIRAVAASAEVDPALVMQYFGTKDELFRQAVHLPADETLPSDPQRLTELLVSIIGVKLGEHPQESLPLLRSMFTYPEATERMRAALGRQQEQATAAIAADDAELRAATIVAVLLGISIGRNLLELDHLRDASPERITDLLRPCFRTLVRGSCESATEPGRDDADPDADVHPDEATRES